MDNVYAVYAVGPNGELYHWGIKGQKWGIRRYQNKDGSLTPAGRKRYNSEMESLKAREKEIKGREKAKARQAKIDAKKAELDEREKALEEGKTSKFKTKTATAKPRTAKDMTDDEIREEINRMRLEKEYYDTRKNLAMANPQKVSAGKKFMDGLVNDVIAPAAKNAGREWLEKTMKDKLGLNKKEVDTLTKLKKEYDTLDYKKKISQLKKDLADDPNQDLKDREARAKLEKSIAEAERDAKKANSPQSEKPNWDDLIKEQNYWKEKQRAEEAKQNYEEWAKQQEEERRKRREQADD